jgi:hypothetical protein
MNRGDPSTTAAEVDAPCLSLSSSCDFLLLSTSTSDKKKNGSLSSRATKHVAATALSSVKNVGVDAIDGMSQEISHVVVIVGARKR